MVVVAEPSLFGEPEFLEDPHRGVVALEGAGDYFPEVPFVEGVAETEAGGFGRVPLLGLVGGDPVAEFAVPVDVVDPEQPGQSDRIPDPAGEKVDRVVVREEVGDLGLRHGRVPVGPVADRRVVPVAGQKRVIGPFDGPESESIPGEKRWSRHTRSLSCSY